MSNNPVFDIFGEPIEVVISSRSTGNSCCAVIQTSPPGGGPPEHIHTREDEIFIVLEGNYAFYDGEKWLKLGPGESWFGVRNRRHAFRNVGTTTGRLYIVVTPGGLDEYFAELAQVSLPEDAERLATINRMYGIPYLAGPGEPPTPS